MDYMSTKERRLNEAMASGQYHKASLSMLDTVDKLKISQKTLDHLEYTEELLKEYLESIKELEGEVPGLIEFLKALKSGDILDNQSMEKENSFLIGVYMQLGRESAIDKLISYLKEKTIISDEEIYEIHRILLYGTSAKDIETIRTKNHTFVAKIVDGHKTFDYFPIDFSQVPEATKAIAELYNRRLIGIGLDNVFIQPFIIHGLLGSLQIFEDGNTRMGRILQHTLMWQLINERTSMTFELPPIYATRTYFPFRNEYRGLISKLVAYDDDDTWNAWFDFNLKRIEDQIYRNNESIYTLKRRANQRNNNSRFTFY